MSRFFPSIAVLVFTVVLLAFGAPLRAQESPMELTADNIHYTDDNKVKASGNVKVSYKEFSIVGAEMDADLDANTAYFPGEVTLTGKDQSAKGHGLAVNLKTREWRFDDAWAELSEKILKGAQSPLWVKGNHVSGSPKLLSLDGSLLTTCNLEHPHYEFKAKSILIYPESKLVARNVSFMAGAHRVFGLPQLVVPLEKGARRQFEMPQMGQSNQEGMFLKTTYNYMASQTSHGAAKLDFTQRQGVGLGLEHAYQALGGAGSLYLYQFLTGGQRTGRLEHNQKLGDMRLRLTADIRDNAYQYASNSSTSNILLYLTRNVHGADSSLSINSNGVSGYGQYRTLTSNFLHNQSFGKNSSGLLGLDYSSFLTPSSPEADTELRSRLDFKSRLPNFDFSVSANKRFDLDGSGYTGDQYYSGVQKLPEVLFATDSSRFKGGFAKQVPMRLQVGYGSFLEQPTNIQTSRGLMQFDLTGKELSWGKTALNLNGGLRQTFYGDGTAQYVITENASLTRKLGKTSQAALTYFNQAPRGYTPFRFDYVAPYKVATARVTWEESPKLNLMLATGYDFLSTGFHWQDLILRTTVSPVKWLSLSSSAVWDLNPNTENVPNRRGLRSVTSRIQLNLKNGLQLDAGARMDMKVGYGEDTGARLSGIKTHFQLPIGKKWKVEGYMGSDGRNGFMRYSDFMITRDLHCWEASIILVNEQGYQAQKGIRFGLSLKAFPFQQRFGVGQFGQSLDTGIGEVY